MPHVRWKVYKTYPSDYISCSKEKIHNPSRKIQYDTTYETFIADSVHFFAVSKQNLSLDSLISSHLMCGELEVWSMVLLICGRDYNDVCSRYILTMTYRMNDLDHDFIVL